MPRARVYVDEAAKQRAYNERKRQAIAEAERMERQKAHDERVRRATVDYNCRVTMSAILDNYLVCNELDMTKEERQIWAQHVRELARKPYGID